MGRGLVERLRARAAVRHLQASESIWTLCVRVATDVRLPRDLEERTSLQEVREYLSQYEALKQTPTPSWLTPVGIDKRDFMSTLDQVADERSVRFGIVFLEACESGVGLNGITHSPNDRNKRPFAQWKLPRGVDYFVSSGSEQIEYLNLDYEKLFRRTVEVGDFQSAFLVEAQRSRLVVQQHSDY